MPAADGLLGGLFELENASCVVLLVEDVLDQAHVQVELVPALVLDLEVVVVVVILVGGQVVHQLVLVINDEVLAPLHAVIRSLVLRLLGYDLLDLLSFLTVFQLQFSLVWLTRM